MVEPNRANELLRGASYEEIIARLAREAVIANHKRERAKSKPRYFRALLTVQASSSVVDLFHNSACGYRAQYWAGVKNGERANAYALEQLAPRLLELLKAVAKRTCPPDWVEKSIAHLDAKVWIHQGLWLRHAKKDHYLLHVDRWGRQRASTDAQRRKRATWASLIPDLETRIDVKGAFLTLTSEPLGTMKPTRAHDIYELGFT
jgi:hypothetical protein